MTSVKDKIAALVLIIMFSASMALSFASGEQPFKAEFKQVYKTLKNIDIDPLIVQSIRTTKSQLLGDAGDTLYWGYLLAALTLCLLLFFGERWGNAQTSSSLQSTGQRRPPPKNFIAFLFPNGFLNNPNVRTDLFLFLTIGIWMTLLRGVFLYLSIDYFTTAISEGLNATFTSPAIEPGITILVLFSIVLVLFSDLEHYAIHYFLHFTKFGWALHQTHHSQRELNIFSDDREHPLFFFLEALVPGIIVGLPLGVFLFLAPGSFEITIANVGLGYFFFRITKVFRHSHIVLRYPKCIEWIFQSPAYHIVHHSSLLQHRDKNLGNVTTLWDRLFGTLYTPQTDEDYEFGTGEAVDIAHTKLRNIYIGQTITIAKTFYSSTIGIAKLMIPDRLLDKQTGDN